MKRFIKKIFNLYDKTDLNKIACTNYMQGYEEGKKVGEQLTLFKKYTPNELRKLLGLDAILTPEEELVKKENKFYIGYDKSNGVDHSALTIIEDDNKGERVLKRTFYDYEIGRAHV